MENKETLDQSTEGQRDMGKKFPAGALSLLTAAREKKKTRKKEGERRRRRGQV